MHADVVVEGTGAGNREWNGRARANIVAFMNNPDFRLVVEEIVNRVAVKGEDVVYVLSRSGRRRAVAAGCVGAALLRHNGYHVDVVDNAIACDREPQDFWAGGMADVEVLELWDRMVGEGYVFGGGSALSSSGASSSR